MEFTYHRHAAGLKGMVAGLLSIVVVDLVVIVALVVLLGPPWNALVAAAGIGGMAWGIWAITKVLRTRHRLQGDRLVLRYGSFRLELAREDIAGAKRASSLPRPIGSSASLSPSYHADDDTLYIVANRTGLVELLLFEAVSTKLSRRTPPIECTRVVVSLDEPERFLEALGVGDSVPENTSEIDRPPSALDSSKPHPAPSAPGRLQLSNPPPLFGESTAVRQDQGDHAILLDGLTKRFGSLTAVDDVHLAVQPGEILAFLGSNGAGKSTTIRLMTGLLRPSQGRVLISGCDVWKEGGAARRLLGYVPDTPLLYESLTAQEYLWFVGGLYDMDRTSAKERAAQLLESLQMARWKDHLIRGFSLGMKRKMSIAAALMHRPRTLLLDEATNGLDPRSARVVKDLIRAEASRGAAVFLTTHLLDLAAELAHKFAILHEGRVRALGTRSEIERSFGLAGSSLEEIFLTLTEETREEEGAR